MNKELIVNEFLIRLYKHTKRKAVLYDGLNANMTTDNAIILIVEELGEVASELTRHRWSSALDECIDVAHCILLLYITILKTKELDK
jgi:hypothetical protein